MGRRSRPAEEQADEQAEREEAFYNGLYFFQNRVSRLNASATALKLRGIFRRRLENAPEEVHWGLARRFWSEFVLPPEQWKSKKPTTNASRESICRVIVKWDEKTKPGPPVDELDGWERA